MFGEQVGLALLEGAAARVPGRELLELTLNPDELAARVAVLLEPVGVNEPRPVVVGPLTDRAQKGVALGHLSGSSGDGQGLTPLAKSCRPSEAGHWSTASRGAAV